MDILKDILNKVECWQLSVYQPKKSWGLEFWFSEQQFANARTIQGRMQPGMLVSESTDPRLCAPAQG